jgi:1-acyl-sn-glycerol-3-phosphate acyltransferase
MAKTLKPIPMPRIKKRELNFALRAVALILAPLVRVMFQVKAKGVEKLPKTGPYILVPNHVTNLDGLAVAYFIYYILHRAPHFLAKEGLFRLPVIGKILLSAGQIPVFRTSGQRNDDSMSAAYKYLEAGHAICIFPEGTLTREPDMWPMRGKTGAVRLAIESNVPVYPVGQWGSEEVLPRYGSKFRPGFWKSVHFVVGDEIDLTKYRKKQLAPEELYEATALVMKEITKLVEGLRGQKAPGTLWNPAEQGQAITGNYIKQQKKKGKSK